MAAALPVIIATVHAVSVGWMPGADQAIIATRAYDVFRSHTPLVGQYTTAAGVIGRVASDPGPMLYWLVALPSRFGDPDAITITMGAVNTLAILAASRSANRRGGRVLMFAAAAGIAFMCRSLAAETFHDEWNASSGLFPLTLLIFHRLVGGLWRAPPVATGGAAGELRGAGASGLRGARAGADIAGAGGLTVARIARRRAAPSDGGSLPAWALAAVLVACVCWTPTVVDDIGHRPGNLTRLIQVATQRKATVGAPVGRNAVVRAIGLPRPWWTYVPRSRYERKYDLRVKPSSLRTAAAIDVLAALALVTVSGLVRGRADLAVAAVIALALCAALAFDAASTPTPRVMAATLGYTMWWGSQVGLWAWLTCWPGPPGSRPCGRPGSCRWARGAFRARRPPSRRSPRRCSASQ